MTTNVTVQHRLTSLGLIVVQLHDHGIVTTAEARAALGLPIGCSRCSQPEPAKKRRK